MFQAQKVLSLVLLLAILSHGPQCSDAWSPCARFIHARQAGDFFAYRARSERAKHRGVASAVGHRRLVQVIPAMQGSSSDTDASALSALMERAHFTARESWRRQESNGEMESRSASGGTSWADGSWLAPDLEKELISMLNRWNTSQIITSLSNTSFSGSDSPDARKNDAIPFISLLFRVPPSLSSALNLSDAWVQHSTL